jgi:hypothetical protein
MYKDGRPTAPMIKFTFRKGGSDHAFVAAGVLWEDSEFQNYEITGNWSSPRKDGKIPIELKITYRQRSDNTELKGVFDPEEDSLRGTTQTGYCAGEFVFKRDPDFIRFYPAPSITNARKRWKFATTSVLDHIQRQAWSPRRILKKIEDGGRFMELALKERHRWELSQSDREEVLALLPGLYEADVRFYSSLIDINATKTAIFS